MQRPKSPFPKKNFPLPESKRFELHSFHKQAEEIKSFELYVAEKECNDNMDSLENLPEKCNKKNIANSVDSLDSLPVRDEPNLSFTDTPEYTKFKDIEKKIEIINKLVTLEEKHLEHVRLLKEMRMKPFECDASSKGYVKNLTKNFDNLSQLKRLETSSSSYECRFVTGMKRNHSLPDVLEGTKLSIHMDTHENSQFGDDNGKEMAMSKGVKIIEYCMNSFYYWFCSVSSVLQLHFLFFQSFVLWIFCYLLFFTNNSLNSSYYFTFTEFKFFVMFNRDVL